MTSNNGEGDRKAEQEGDGEQLIGKIEAEGNEGELKRKIERWMCVEARAKVEAIDVFADLRTLRVLILVSTA